ncbi:MAG: PD-(D/E)XK nuclease family protein, partial [Clostridia bacterium]|nr:PD-(D/E)XK nuclease family protein [Clostridia bacterium]
VKDYLEDMNMESRIEELAQRQSDFGYEELSSITLQSLGKITALLNQFEAMLGESKMSLEEFLGIMTAAIESVETSNIPLFLDSVFIGESSESRYENIDYMFIIGAAAGKFPPEHNDTGIVSEREYAAWSKLGIDVQPDCRRRNSRERLNALMTLTRARKGLRVSYSASGAGGEETQPSSTVHYLCELLNISPNQLEMPNVTWQERDYAKYVSAKGNVTEEILYINSLIKSGYLPTSDAALQVEDKLYALACEKDGKTYVDSLLSGGEEEEQLSGMSEIAFNGNHTSVSQFEKYFKCPFLHFNENVLKLKTREVSGLEVKDTGILLHATLEKYFSLPDCADKSEGDIEKVVPELFRQAVKDEPDYAYMLDDVAHTLKLQQLISQAVYVVKNLVKNMQVTKFRPSMVEASFGAKYPKYHDLKGMEINSGYRTLSFEGVIDRIDRYKDRAIVIDYKSKYVLDFTPSNILYGDRIQLFVYLNALRRNGDITPQGAFYLLMNNRFVSGGDKLGKRFMYHGFVNSQEEYLQDLDKGFADGSAYSGNVYPIKRKIDKNGEVTYSKLEHGELLNTQGFEDTCEYVMKLAQKAAREIEEGYIAKSPLNIGGEESVKACKYCNFANVCARSTVKARNVKKVDIEEFSQITGGDKRWQ